MAQWRNCPEHGQYAGHGACPYGCASEFNKPSGEPDALENALAAIARAAKTIATLVDKKKDGDE
jgi:hypothetical protein